MTRKKDKPGDRWGFIKDLFHTPVVVPSTPSVVATHLVSALGPMVSEDHHQELVEPQLDPPLTEEERDLVKALTGKPYVRFVWD